MAQDASPTSTPRRRVPVSNAYAAELEDDEEHETTPSKQLQDVDLKDIDLTDTPETSPKPKTHARIESNASAASAFSLASDVSVASAATAASKASKASKASRVSAVSFEEVGFDDGPGWTDAPGQNLPPLARIGELSDMSVHSSPRSVRTERPDTPSKGPVNGLGLRMDGEVPLVLGVAVVDFNHLVRVV